MSAKRPAESKAQYIIREDGIRYRLLMVFPVVW